MQKQIMSIEHARQLVKIKKCGRGSRAFYQFHIQMEILTDNARAEIRALLETSKNNRFNYSNAKLARNAFASLILCK